MRLCVDRGNVKLNLEFKDGTPFPFQEVMSDMEYLLIFELLKKYEGVKANVAKDLQLNRTTLVEKCKKYGFPIRKAV